MTLNQLTEKIEQNPILDFGTVFSSAIELFKKVWLQGFITILLTLVLMIPLYLIFYVPFIVLGVSNPATFESDVMAPVMGLAMFLLMPVLILGVMTISVALNAAFMRICRMKDLGISEPEDYFYYLKNGRWKKSLGLGLLMLLVAIAGMLLCGVGLIYAMVPLSLLPAFFAFNEELSSIDILKACFKLGNKNWFIIFGLIILSGIMAELGIVLCGVGIFFTAMFSKVPTYYMYKNGVGFKEDGV
ncbi:MULTISPECIES: hypothetical protein [Zobellia]|uniref:hypothetical protein n=1 Tax=Zobellia TaxID=112040 RepID=UPI000B52DC00|nr:MULTISPECIES: hypothetical protein [Zobellia]MBU3028307.1 hypothetical protein [Zobellia galactanivorans]OWW26276.1 hypothetical protein B4Q04_00910 [Zobellia sp. OII3]